MKTLFITYNGSTESIFKSQVMPYLKGLSEKGHEISLLSYEREISDNEAIRKYFEKEGIRWFHLRYHKFPRICASAYDFLAGIMLVFCISIKYKVEIIHTRATHGGLIGLPAAKVLGKKFIFDTRGLDSEEYADGALIARKGFIYKCMMLVEKILFSSSDAIVLLSKNAIGLLRDNGLMRCCGDRPMFVIPCTADLDLFKVKKTRMDHNGVYPKLIYIGSLGTWYMLDEMLDFFGQLKKLNKNAVFSIFTQSDKNIVMDKINQRKLADCVKVGFAGRDQMPEILREHDVGISFIQPVSSKRASSPTKMGEYLASGLPVVINENIGDTAAIVKENRVGVVLNNFRGIDHEKAAEEITRLLTDEDLASRCRRTAEKYYSLKDAVDKYDKIYRSI